MIRQEVHLRDNTVITITEESREMLEKVVLSKEPPKYIDLKSTSGSRTVIATSEIRKIQANPMDEMYQRALKDAAR